jgi:hypothetical protein
MIKLLRQLPNFTNRPSVLEHMFKKIFEDIALWDEDLQITFAESMRKSVLLLVNNTQTVTLINIILKFFITTITDENNTVTSYLRCFDEMINGFNNKIEVKKDILDYINSLGSFGKNSKSRRYSAYFCSCIYRVNIIDIG